MSFGSSARILSCLLLFCMHALAVTPAPNLVKMADASDVLPSQLMVTDSTSYRKNAEGLAALNAGDYARATALFSEASSLQPQYWDAKNNLGVVFFRTKDTKSARSVFQEIVTQDPKYAVAHYNLGVIALNSRDYARASQYFKTAQECRKNFLEAMAMGNRVDLLQGKTAPALAALKDLYKEHPGHALVWQTYAYALLQVNDAAAADRVLVSQDKSPAAAQMRILIAMQKGDYGAALAAAKKSVSLGGPASDLVEVAGILVEKGSPSQALDGMQIYLATAQKPTADAWLYAGTAAKECGKNSLAREYFQKGVAQYPGDQMLLYNSGYLYFVEKDYVKAEQAWSQLADADRDASLLYQRALTARYSGDPARARTLITRALSLDQKAEYHDLLGVLLRQAGKRQEAAVQFQKALALDPALESAQINAMLLDKSSPKLPALIAAAQAGVDTCTDDCEAAYVRLSVLYHEDGKTGQALSVLEKIPAEKRSERMHRAMALYLFELQRFGEAAALLQKVKASHVVEPGTEMQLVDCYIKTGNTARAIAALKDLLPHWEGNPWRLYYQLGYLYYEQNKLDLARQNFESSITSMNKNPAARGMLALVYSRMGEPAKARELWEQTTTDDPTNPTLWINLGLVYDEEGDHYEAVHAYEKAYSLDTANKALCLNIGNAYASVNRHREARAAYAKALRSPQQRELAAYNSFISSQKDGDEKTADKMLKILQGEFAKSPYTQRALAEKALGASDTARAVSILEGLAGKNDEDRAILAFLYTAQKKIETAKTMIDQLPQTNRWHATRLQLRASLQFAQGDYNTSYSLFEALHDTSFAVAYNMALSAYNAKRYDETVRLAARYATTVQGADRLSVCRLVGNAYFAQKKWDKALQMYAQLFGLDSRNALIQYNIAVAYYNLDRIEDAWKYYDGARNLDKSIKNRDIEMKFLAHVNKGVASLAGDTLSYLYNNAVALQEEGKDSTAKTIYLRILQDDSTYSRAWNNLGTIFASESNYRESEKCYKKAIGGKDIGPEVFANLVRISLAVNDLPKARYWLQKSRTSSLDDAMIAELSREVEGKSKGK